MSFRDRDPVVTPLDVKPNPCHPEFVIVSVRCPHCDGIHTHGARPGQDPGHRVSHCHGTGYFIRNTNTNPMPENQENTMTTTTCQTTGCDNTTAHGPKGPFDPPTLRLCDECYRNPFAPDAPPTLPTVTDTCFCGEPELSWKEIDRDLLDIYRHAEVMGLTQFVNHLYHLAYSVGARDASVAAASEAYAEGDAYLRKPRREFLQMDGWVDREAGDAVMVPDADGDVTMAGLTTDRQKSGTTVRVLIDPTASAADVLRVLGKLTAWYERDQAALLNPPCPL